MAPLTVSFERDATRALARIPTNQARPILAKIEQYARDPNSLSPNVSALRGQPGYRLRVGDWRVIFTLGEGSVHVLAIGARGSVYE